MVKVSLTKLNKIKSLDPIDIKIGEETISVVQYLPLEKKLTIMQNIIEQAGNNEEGFYNIVKLTVFYTIEMLRAYTNISFTEKQLEEPQKLYDIIVLNNIWETVKDSIPEKERDYIWDNTCALAREITEYNHSALGILKLMSDDYENLNFDVQEITEKLSDRTNLDLVRNLLTKLV
ncbi:MAG: hypothetical protein SOX92_03295 [Candidatus Onthovivens sp.]|jgi:hypothetical protein|nr:hypothetical protein [Candidatus Onthovivens sp.]